MTATLDAGTPVVSAAPVKRRRGVPPVAVLAAAGVGAAASVFWMMAGASVLFGALLAVAGAPAIAWAAFVAVRQRSYVVAPIAIAVLVAMNPVVLGAIGSVAEDRLGRVSYEADTGVVFWQQYPGIAGWTAPAEPLHADTDDLVSTAHAHMTLAVETLAAESDWAWEATEPAALTPIPNGFGGGSLFDRIDGPVWSATGFGRTDAERALLLDVAAGLAEKLRLPVIADSVGNVETGSGVRGWSGDSGCVLTLTIDGGIVRFSFSGGPYLRAGVSVDEYATALAPFARVTLPDPIFLPALP